MSKLILHELTLSPNNVKVRIGLGYKGLDYERRPFEATEFPGDRSSIVALSRQPRLPVLQHGKTVVYDSRGILRYLDANFPDTPALFATDYATMGEIEVWEAWARAELGQPIGAIFEEIFKPQPDPEVGRRASAQLDDLSAKVEAQLAKSPFLVVDHPTGADLACAPLLNLAMLPDAVAASHPIAGFFQQHLHLGDGRKKTRAWVKKLIAYDPAFSA